MKSPTLEDLMRLPELVAGLRAELDELKARLDAPKVSPNLLTANQAAEILSMTPAAVRQAAYRGSLPCVRLGRSLGFGLRT